VFGGSAAAGAGAGASGRLAMTVDGPMPLRGRDHQVLAIGAAIETVIDGRPGVVLIEGSAGYGKSRLLEDTALKARAAGVRVAVAGADGDDRHAPFVPLLAALSNSVTPVLGRDELRALHELRDERYWFVLELGEVLERAALINPLLISLDDLQWADASTLDAIRTLSGRLGGAPILWVLAFRPRHESLALGRLITELDDSKTTNLVLDALDPAAVREVIGDHLHVAPDDALVEAAAAADGVPFFLVEMIRGLVGEDLVDSSGPFARLRDGSVPLASMVAIDDRLRQLSLEGRHVIQVGAVLGRAFRSDDVATMLDIAPSNMIDVFDDLIRADVLVSVGDHWAFRHDIIRQGVLDGMAIPMRRTLERHAADVLLAAGIPPIDVARRVALGAELGDRRAIETLAAAARSLLATDPATAAELSEHAFTLTPVGDPTRARLAGETAIAMHLSGRERAAVQLAGEMLVDITDAEQYSELQLSIAKMYSLPGQTRVECGLRGLGATGISDVLRARHLAVLVLSHTAAGDVRAAGEIAAEAATVIEDVGDAHAEQHLEFSQMSLDEATYRYADALGRVATIRRLASTTGDSAPVLAADWLRANVLVSLDEFQQAWDVSTGALRFAAEHRQAWIASRWEFWQGWFLLQRGRLSDGRAVLDGALTAEGLGAATALPDAAGVAALGRLARHMDDRRLVDRCLHVARASLELPTADDARRHLGWFVISQALTLGDTGTARDVLSSIRRNGVVLPGLALDVGAEVAAVRAGRQLGDWALAENAASAARERAGANPSCVSLAGIATHATSLHLDDIEGLMSASEMLAPGPRPLAACSAFEDLGRLLAESGRRSDAVEAFGRSLEFATGTGAIWDARRIRQRLRALGVRRRLAVPTRPANGWDALTPAELAVAIHAGHGMTNREAAETLFVSPHTVGAHMRHVFEKLGIKSRVELARVVSARERPATSG
jgi:DNA-binding CsgD family transcriptional regulator